MYRETAELAKICHARLSQRQPVLSHTFVKIFVWKKWEKVWWCFAISRLLHVNEFSQLFKYIILNEKVTLIYRFFGTFSALYTS